MVQTSLLFAVNWQFSKIKRNQNPWILKRTPMERFDVTTRQIESSVAYRKLLPIILFFCFMVFQMWTPGSALTWMRASKKGSLYSSMRSSSNKKKKSNIVFIKEEIDVTFKTAWQNSELQRICTAHQIEQAAVQVRQNSNSNRRNWIAT